MKRTLVTLLSLVSALIVSAETSSMVEISAGGEWRKANTYETHIHIGYGIMLHPYVGLGLGADVARHATSQQLDDSITWTATQDSEGEKYQQGVSKTEQKEAQTIYQIEVPLSLYIRIPLAANRTFFSAVAGGKIGIPFYSSATYTGLCTQVGNYTQWNLLLEDVKGHGFETKPVSRTIPVEPRVNYATFVKIGIETAIDTYRQWWFFTHAVSTYYFVKNDEALPISIGLEIGVRYRFPHAQPHSCKCLP